MSRNASSVSPRRSSGPTPSRRPPGAAAPPHRIARGAARIFAGNFPGASSAAPAPAASPGTRTGRADCRSVMIRAVRSLERIHYEADNSSSRYKPRTAKPQEAGKNRQAKQTQNILKVGVQGLHIFTKTSRARGSLPKPNFTHSSPARCAGIRQRLDGVGLAVGAFPFRLRAESPTAPCPRNTRSRSASHFHVAWTSSAGHGVLPRKF